MKKSLQELLAEIPPSKELAKLFNVSVRTPERWLTFTTAMPVWALYLLKSRLNWSDEETGRVAGYFGLMYADLYGLRPKK